MKTIVFAQQKGGAGKTTLCAHLAVAAELSNNKTVLLDADPQQSLAEWWRIGQSEAPAFAAAPLEELPGKLKALAAAEYKVAMVDTPGAATPVVAALVALADLVLIPVRASPHDLRALSETLAMVRAAKVPFRFVLSSVNTRSRLTAQAVAALSEHGAVSRSFISARQDFVSSMVDGRSALQTAPGSPAAAEIRALWTYVRAQLKQGN